MASVFAELERAMIRDRTRAAMWVKRGRGERISHPAPFGWDFGPRGTVVENLAEQRIIGWIRQLRAKGKTPEKCSRLDGRRNLRLISRNEKLATRASRQAKVVVADSPWRFHATE